MGLSRSTFYDPLPASTVLGDVLTRIGAICDEFECYGYRRVGSTLKLPFVHVGSTAISTPCRCSGYILNGFSEYWSSCPVEARGADIGS